MTHEKVEIRPSPQCDVAVQALSPDRTLVGQDLDIRRPQYINDLEQARCLLKTPQCRRTLQLFKPAGQMRLGRCYPLGQHRSVQIAEHIVAEGDVAESIDRLTGINSDLHLFCRADAEYRPSASHEYSQFWCEIRRLRPRWVSCATGFHRRRSDMWIVSVVGWSPTTCMVIRAVS